MCVYVFCSILVKLGIMSKTPYQILEMIWERDEILTIGC
jgi:hypothetical protein